MAIDPNIWARRQQASGQSSGPFGKPRDLRKAPTPASIYTQHVDQQIARGRQQNDRLYGQLGALAAVDPYSVRSVVPTGTPVSDAFYKAAQSSIAGQLNSLAASQRGVSAAAASRNAMNANVQGQGNLNTQMGVMRANESSQNQALRLQELAQLMNRQVAAYGLQGDAQGRRMNMETAIKLNRMQQDAQPTFGERLLGASLEGTGMIVGGLAGGPAGAAMGGKLGGVAGDSIKGSEDKNAWISSDEREKKGIQRNAQDVDRTLDGLRPASFEYRNPGNAGAAPGRQVGVMAQDLQRTPMGRQAVAEGTNEQGHERLYVNNERASQVALAGTARLNERLRRLERAAGVETEDDKAAAVAREQAEGAEARQRDAARRRRIADRLSQFVASQGTPNSLADMPRYEREIRRSASSQEEAGAIIDALRARVIDNEKARQAWMYSDTHTDEVPEEQRIRPKPAKQRPAPVPAPAPRQAAPRPASPSIVRGYLARQGLGGY